MLSCFLDNVIKYKINNHILKFKPLSLEDHFFILQEESEFLFWMLQGVKTESGEIVEDHDKFVKLMMAKYPRIIYLVIALCYIQEDNEVKMSLQEKKLAINNIPARFQLEILNLILQKSYPEGMYEEIKKMEDQLSQVMSKIQS